MSELLREMTDFSSIDTELEEIQEGISKKKNYYVKGPFLEAETLNHNKRRYPKSIIEREVEKYQKAINEKTAVGELNHPPTSSIDLERVSHLVTELKMENNIAVGKAKILEGHPKGDIAKALLENGVKIGISSRGLGSLREGIVQSDYNFICCDLVAQPSGPSCFLDGILESRTEWVLENGILVEKEIKEIQEEADKIVIEHKFSLEERQAAFMKLFQDTMLKISKK